MHARDAQSMEVRAVPRQDIRSAGQQTEVQHSSYRSPEAMRSGFARFSSARQRDDGGVSLREFGHCCAVPSWPAPRVVCMVEVVEIFERLRRLAKLKCSTEVLRSAEG